MENKLGRRSFIKMSAVTLAAVAGGSLLVACGASPTATSTSVSSAATTAAQTTSAATTTTAAASSAADTASAGGNMTGAPVGGMMGGGAIDKSSDTQLQAMISAVESKFKQFQYTDSQTGKTVPYNLFIPANYDTSKSYPLVTFIADSSVVGQDTTAPLTQGYGGIIWASEADQAKHESFVLVPEFPEVVIDDNNGNSTISDYVDLTARLIDSVTSQYSIDKNRLYATGQSMGCMTFLVLSARYPDLFAAEMFVSGQWDTGVLGNLAKEKFFYIAAEGDSKASAGQTDVENMLQSAGTKFSTASWDATWTADQFTTAVANMLAEGNNINIPTFKKGTVLPSGVAVGTSEHMYSFDYAYKIDAVRDWLFKQSK